MFNLEEINFYLLKNNPFFFGLLQQSKILLDPKSKYIAFVAIKNKIEMTLNPEKLKDLPVSDQASLMIHEFNHLFSGHIRQSLHKQPESICAQMGIQYSPVLTNIAMDCEVNSRIADLQESITLGPKSKGELRGVFAQDFNLPDRESWQFHLKKLINDNKDKAKPSDGKDHEYFQMSDGDPDFSDHIIANSIKKAKENVRQLGHGNMPKEAEEFLDEVERRKSLPWNLILRQFIQALVSVDLSSSWKKRNRRFGNKLPGVKKEPRIKLLVGLDESGSVSDDERTKFLNELRAIHETGAVELWIAQFDTDIHDYFKFDGTLPPRRASGGTSFHPVHLKAIEERFKGVIMLTDGECNYPDPSEITYKSLWVMSTDMKAPYGQSIRIR